MANNKTLIIISIIVVIVGIGLAGTIAVHSGLKEEGILGGQRGGRRKRKGPRKLHKKR